jgi:hypothetical protein
MRWTLSHQLTSEAESGRQSRVVLMSSAKFRRLKMKETTAAEGFLRVREQRSRCG